MLGGSSVNESFGVGKHERTQIGGNLHRDAQEPLGGSTSLKQVTLGALLAVWTFVMHATAQKNELSGLIGRTFISDQGIREGTLFDNNVHFGNGLTFEVNYARRVLEAGLASVSLEVPVVVNWDEDLSSDAVQDPRVLSLTS